MQFLKKYSSQLIVLTFLFGYFSIFFGEVFWSPNSILLSSDGDGMKNYFTFAYQVRHQGASLHFSGMNYPYGDHVLYTDGMPLLGFFVGLLPFLKGYEIGIFHFFLFGSVGLGALIWLRIFYLLKIQYWLSIAGAISIIVMSPQMYRINGHFSLSLIWVIALMFLLIIKWHQGENKLKYSIYLGLCIFLSFFTHAYLGLMCFLFVSSALFYFWIWRRVRIGVALKSIGLVSLGVILFLLFLKLSDLHMDRTNEPNGLFENYGFLETTFVPVFSPFKPILQLFFPILHNQPWEGWSYIGIITLTVLLAGIITRTVQKIRRKPSTLIITNDPMQAIFAAGITLLFFSYLIPLKWFSQDFVYSLKIFNQFRALGRFAWIFYYSAQLYALVILSRALMNKKVLQWAFAFIIPCFAVVESHQMHDWIFAKWKLGPNLFSTEILKQQKDLNKVISIMRSEPDAVILPLPYFHIGSERINLDTPNEIRKLAFVTSFHTGYPMIANIMSRTSVSETKSIVQIFNSVHDLYGPKELTKKWIWIITNNEIIYDNQKEFLNYATPKFQSKKLSLYLLDYGKYCRERHKNFEDRLKKTINSRILVENFLLSDSTFLVVDNFEKDISANVFAGKGAKTVPRAQYSVLAYFTSKEDQILNGSFWYYIDKDKNYSGLIVVEEVDTLTGQGAWIVNRDLNQFTAFDKDWELVDVDFPVKKGPYTYKFFLVGSFENRRTFTFDNLVIRRKDIDVKTSEKDWCPEGREMFNNFPLK